MTDLEGLNPLPWDWQTAKKAMKAAASRQAAQEDSVRDTKADLAERERRYRIALRGAIMEIHANGMAVTVARDLALGREDIAQLRYERDLAEGVHKAAGDAIYRHTANRKDVRALAMWSRGVAPDGQYEEGEG